MRKLDLTGEKYGRLTALSRAESRGRRTVWNFLCDCGAIKAIGIEAVRAGLTRSCGCFRDESLATRSITHGHSVGRRMSRELKAYGHARSRCTNPNDEKYPQYGGRGISMCSAWLNNAAQFISDMGPCPPKHSIDRVNPNGNYEPGNCRWATSHQQARTRTDNVIVDFQGTPVVLKDYAALVGVNYKSLHSKLRYQGKTLAQATSELLKV